MNGLDAAELATLVRRVFAPRADDRALAVLVDLPDEALPDHDAWRARRRMAASWTLALEKSKVDLGLERVSLIAYRNVRRNNADLPAFGRIVPPSALPERADDPGGVEVGMEDALASHTIVLAPTELSATAPLKNLAKRLRFRAATMPGFSEAMIPALRLDWVEIDAKCRELKRRLDRADGAACRFTAGGRDHELYIDLRHRAAIASGGLVAEPGIAGNLPSGETYIVPYEGERAGDSSLTRGTLPLEIAGELLHYEIAENRVARVVGDGPEAARERAEMDAEAGYRNVAELGLGILRAYGVRPVGALLLDEKLGLHIAFGRSDHFGGTVGPSAFSAPDKVIHLDRVYIPEVQPQVRVASVDLVAPDGSREALMRDGDWV
jgi:leucyl aminopeptidase (aminopeptidase T)